MDFTRYISARVAREAGKGTSEWAKIIKWAKQPGMLNLGQGFPDFVPDFTMSGLSAGVKDALQDNQLNQYSQQTGLLELREAIARLHKVHFGETVAAADEVAVMPGGTGGLFAAAQAFVNPGDEVVVFDPSFPWYGPLTRFVGGEL